MVQRAICNIWDRITIIDVILKQNFIRCSNSQPAGTNDHGLYHVNLFRI